MVQTGFGYAAPLAAAVAAPVPPPAQDPAAMTDLLSALLLGILEGLTEFLPISSTGHLLIAQHWLGARSDFFNIVIQAGAIVAITLVFRQRLWALATGLGEAANRDYALKLALAFLVTAVVGLPVRLMGWELPETVTPVAWALVLGGLWMLFAERLAERRPDGTHVTWSIAVLVGLAQVVAGVFPGTSRSAAAIFIAMLAGLSRRASATEFVFLVGIPTMFAASGYAFLELALDGRLAQESWLEVALAFAAATVTGFVVVKWLLGYIKSHRFTGFALYRIALGIALLVWLPGE
jgi:undecaprenyl-diphosphatase